MGSQVKKKVNTGGVGVSRKNEWGRLIQQAQEKLLQSRRKTSQLEALLATFETQAKAGDPCPTEIMKLSEVLTSRLQ
jgi:hypothetical protein